MPTNKAIRETFRKDPEFSERVQAILQLHNSPMLIDELENEYIEIYNLQFSPLIHCTATQKGIILSTVPNCKIFSEVNKDPFLGNVIVIKAAWNGKKERKNRLTEVKNTFDKSFKCLSQNRNIQEGTINKHAKILVECFNEARTLVHNNREELNQSHCSYVSKLFLRIRSNLISVKEKYHLDISIPTVLNTPLTAEPSPQLESDTDTTEKVDVEEEEENIDEKNINDLTIPAVITLPEAEEENWLESESNCSTVEDNPVIIPEQEEMAFTPIEFLKLASSLIPEFDGTIRQKI